MGCFWIRVRAACWQEKRSHKSIKDVSSSLFTFSLVARLQISVGAIWKMLKNGATWSRLMWRRARPPGCALETPMPIVAVRCRILAARINLGRLIGDSGRTLTECLPAVLNKSDGKFQVVLYLYYSHLLMSDHNHCMHACVALCSTQCHRTGSQLF